MNDDTLLHKCDNAAAVDKFQVLHKGVSHGVLPLLPVEPSEQVGCALHLMLSVCGTLWVHGVCANIVGENRDAIALKLNEKLTSLRIHRFEVC